MNTFKVLQFNMQFGQGLDDAYPEHAPVNLDLTISEIFRHKADIVILQEVEQAQPGGVQITPPPNFTRLRAALDRYHSFSPIPKRTRASCRSASAWSSSRKRRCATPCVAICHRRRSSSNFMVKRKRRPTGF